MLLGKIHGDQRIKTDHCITHEPSEGGSSAQELRKLAGAIAVAQASGVKVDDVFPIGIVVQPDGFSLRGYVDV
jgi:hypothetical protein